MSSSKFIGQTNWKGVTVNLYQSIDIEGDKKSTYSYYTNAVTGEPVYYEMVGYDSLLGSHYDRYYVEYFNFNTNPIDPSVFAISTSKLVINYIISYLIIKIYKA